MATIKHARTVALQATSPRIVPVPLPTNVTVDLSNTAQALNKFAIFFQNDDFGKDDIVTRDYDRSSEFLISLLRNKFKLYLKP